MASGLGLTLRASTSFSGVLMGGGAAATTLAAPHSSQNSSSGPEKGWLHVLHFEGRGPVLGLFETLRVDGTVDDDEDEKEEEDGGDEGVADVVVCTVLAAAAPVDVPTTLAPHSMQNLAPRGMLSPHW